METQNKRNTDMEIDLLDLLSMLLHRWVMLLLGLVIGALLAGGYTYMQPSVYQSTAQLFILSQTTSITSLADIQLGSSLSSDFVVISTSKPILDTVVENVEEKYGYQLTRSQVESMTSVSVIEDTRILQFTAKSGDPVLACAVANEMKDATALQIAEIMQSDLPTTVEEAEVSTTPLGRGVRKRAIEGAVVGLLIMALLFVIPYLLNDRINTREDVEKYLEEGVLAVIPLDRELESKNKKSRKKGKTG